MQQTYPFSHHLSHLEDLLSSLSETRFNLIIIKTVDECVFGCFFIGKAVIHDNPHWHGSH